MSEEEQQEQRNGTLHGAGAVLGSGLGAAVGFATGGTLDILNGTWIGSLIGLGLAMLYSAIG